MWDDSFDLNFRNWELKSYKHGEYEIVEKLGSGPHGTVHMVTKRFDLSKYLCIH